METTKATRRTIVTKSSPNSVWVTDIRVNSPARRPTIPSIPGCSAPNGLLLEFLLPPGFPELRRLIAWKYLDRIVFQNDFKRSAIDRPKEPSQTILGRGPVHGRSPRLFQTRRSPGELQAHPRFAC